MNEFDFIDKLKAAFRKASPEGIGDDAAYMGGLLIANDVMVSGVHFLPDEPVYHIVRKLFGCNVSDICAMGGLSGGYSALLGIACDKTLDGAEFAEAVAAVCREYDITLIGGDTASSVCGVFLSATIIGKAGKYILTRSGARAGDRVYLSRAIGGAAFDLAERLAGRVGEILPNAGTEPERALGAFLGGREGVTACIDISDGLGRDLNRIALASGVRIVIEKEKIPLSPQLGQKEDAVVFALSSGEEYCLAFTVSPAWEKDLLQAVRDELHRGIFCIGSVSGGSGTYMLERGILTDISRMGYEHTFRRPETF